MRHVISLFAAVSSLFYAFSSLASEAPVPYGVWQGTIGKYPIVAMLADGSCDPSSSGYYYLRHLLTVHVEQNPGSALTWNEGPEGKGATWTLESATADTLHGKWTSADGKRTLPIALKRITVALSQNQCHAQLDAYNKPRVDKVMGELSTQDAKLGALRYATLSVMGNQVSTFEIMPGQYNVPKINSGLREGLRTEIASALGCQDDASENAAEYDAGENLAQYDSHTRPTRLVYGHILLTKTDFSAFCGGAHPESWSEYGAWNLVTDTPIHVDKWVRFNKSSSGTPELPDKLKALLHKYAPKQDNSDCGDTLTDPDTSFSVSLGSAGLVFHSILPHVMAPCEQDIELPFSNLMPFLTPEGKKEAQKLMKESQER